MDAFSLALVYGMSESLERKRIVLTLIVGIYHFIMPILGLRIGLFIESINFINLHYIAAIILAYIGIDLIISSYKKESTISISNIGLFLFAFSVSIDSFTIGVILKEITNHYILAPFLFSICSSLFTYLGIILGNLIGNRIGIYSKYIGGVILIMIAFFMFMK